MRDRRACRAINIFDAIRSSSTSRSITGAPVDSKSPGAPAIGRHALVVAHDHHRPGPAVARCEAVPGRPRSSAGRPQDLRCRAFRRVGANQCDSGRRLACCPPWVRRSGKRSIGAASRQLPQRLKPKSHPVGAGWRGPQSRAREAEHAASDRPASRRIFDARLSQSRSDFTAWEREVLGAAGRSAAPDWAAAGSGRSSRSSM